MVRLRYDFFFLCNRSCSPREQWGGVLYLLRCDFQNECKWASGDVNAVLNDVRARWEKHGPPFHSRCLYMVLAADWLAIRMWEVSFSSWKVGFCVPWGLDFCFSVAVGALAMAMLLGLSVQHLYGARNTLTTNCHEVWDGFSWWPYLLTQQNYSLVSSWPHRFQLDTFSSLFWC